MNGIFNTERIYIRFYIYSHQQNVSSTTMVFCCRVMLVPVRLRAVLEYVLFLFCAEIKKKEKEIESVHFSHPNISLVQKPLFPEVMV